MDTIALHRSRTDLLAQGLTDDELRTARRRGTMTRIGPGLYVDTARYAALTDDERYVVRIRAVAARHPTLVVSHRSAAALLDLPLLASATGPVHLTRPGHSGHRGTPEVVVHTGRLDDREVVTCLGSRCTRIARTVVDCARVGPGAEAVVVADAALQRGLVDPAAIRACLAAAVNVKGRPRAVRALARVDGRSESPWETLLRLTLDVPQLPPLELQIEVRDDGGHLLGRTDGGYLEHGVLIEFDGLVKYGGRLRPGETAAQAVVAEKRREERISGLGWLVIRVIAAELRDPQRLIGRIRRACADRQRLVRAGAIRGAAVPRPPLRLALDR